ncbi:MAG: tRNA (adenosine(37)-N6)-dimethylallyltransferase MiaA [Ignavibacteriae bacterium]|nr:tRNA (adenosine(37)-N6)-dimethylallyltransferase MiaA [Ignavibacteriota bacterium]MCB9217059.1 tRNA (adenosine(37)-N6)-dimethylallyltransferase MiaA [Ignavibacteria bacterium]
MDAFEKVRERSSISIPVIVGPTASGKTGLALNVAQLDSRVEIISADSRQVYVGMNIGTAKPSEEILSTIPHHLIDIITPNQTYSAGTFARDAQTRVDDILARNQIPVVVGGTGFYVRALFEGLAAPAADREVVAELEERAAKEGYEVLYRELLKVDPEAAQMYPKENRVKTYRALACWYQTGEKYSAFLSSAKEGSHVEPLVCLILPERELLYRRINDRVVEMIDQGLIEETNRLLESGYRPDDPGMRTVGYKEVLQVLEGKIEESELVPAIQQATRRYAKRQSTWFRNQLRDCYVVASASEGEEWLRGIVERWRN